MASNTTINVKSVKTHKLSPNSTLIPPIVSVTGTYSVNQEDSGRVHLINSSAGNVTITLPSAKQGLKYIFIVGTAGNNLVINAAADTDHFQGLCIAGPSLTLTATNAGNTTAFVGPAAGDHIYNANADTDGRMVGTRIVFECINDAMWNIEGALVTSGAVATPFTT